MSNTDTVESLAALLADGFIQQAEHDDRLSNLSSSTNDNDDDHACGGESRACGCHADNGEMSDTARRLQSNLQELYDMCDEEYDGALENGHNDDGSDNDDNNNDNDDDSNGVVVDELECDCCEKIIGDRALICSDCDESFCLRCRSKPKVTSHEHTLGECQNFTLNYEVVNDVPTITTADSLLALLMAESENELALLGAVSVSECVVSIEHKKAGELVVSKCADVDAAAKVADKVRAVLDNLNQLATELAVDTQAPPSQ